MKTLEEWKPDADDLASGLQQSLDLNSGGANGWSAAEMFQVNTSRFNVETTYKDNLEGYTVQLSKDKSSKEYR